ncbi:MAG: hypothetical protein HC925_05260 [Coleofasciculaceae cyanobacterium SM2_3_26]|nr:hypothetical protein [Coleofasciculaceae cyanobacterium SM2_3_26]
MFSGAASTGNSGNISIHTQRLLLQNGAVIYAPTFQTGRGGNLNIRAAESITLDASVLATIALPGSNGTSGNIDIHTGQFLAERGGFVAASTLGTGVGGNITLNSTQSVALLTTPEIALIPTGIFSNSILGTGAAGDVSVTTPDC